MTIPGCIVGTRWGGTLRVEFSTPASVEVCKNLNNWSMFFVSYAGFTFGWAKGCDGLWHWIGFLQPWVWGVCPQWHLVWLFPRHQIQGLPGSLIFTNLRVPVCNLGSLGWWLYLAWGVKSKPISHTCWRERVPSNRLRSVEEEMWAWPHNTQQEKRIWTPITRFEKTLLNHSIVLHTSLQLAGSQSESSKAHCMLDSTCEGKLTMGFEG